MALDRAASRLKADAVVTDNRAATSEAAAHLLDFDHRDILVVTSTFRLENIRERFTGAVEQFSLRGLPPPPSLEVGLTFELVAERMANWLAVNQRPTAFLAVTSFVTIGVLSRLSQIGLTRAAGSFSGQSHRYATDCLFSQRPLSAAGEQRWDIRNSTLA